MGQTLGLDLGSNSIGWALVDEAARSVVATGVRVFPEGVDRDKQGGEVSKNENRRIKRGMRRQLARRARRKRLLRAALAEAGLLPTDPAAQRALDALDPYALRARGLDEKLTLQEFGRALVHLNQRRGFKSNRKTANGAAKKEEQGLLAEISALARVMLETGARTLGEYLHRASTTPEIRLRGRHTRREMLLQEFDLLWATQAKYWPGVVTEERRQRIRDRIIFYQRPLYWPKSVVGACELEPKKKRCRRADRLAQKFRLMQEVNNLKVIEPTGELRPLTPEERTSLLDYLRRAKERTFDQIRQRLNLTESHGFNLEGGDRKKLLGMPTDVLLASAEFFGKSWWEQPEGERDQIVRALLNEKLEEDELRKLALEQWKVTAQQIEALLDLELPAGYASLSREAMEKLIPWLEQGLPLMAGDNESSALREAGYLRPDQRVVHQQEYLPPPPDLTNPIVRHALHQVRQLVNAIIREIGRPECVIIELAREVKGSAAERERMSRTMREREKRRSTIAEKIRGMGLTPTREAIQRYLLWEEQGGLCMYSGAPISAAQLLGGEVQIDHILPYGRSLDDSLMNKVVCFRDENAAKGDRTPHEWLAATDPAKYEAILQRAARLPMEVRNAKRPKFAQKTVELTEFIERQLNDTKYISRKVAEYLRCLGVDIVCTKGQQTAELRHRWGLDTVLRNDGLGLKNREDHRHHAVDAVVIALTDRRRLQALARAWSAGALEFPWENFRQDVETQINAIRVSHRVERRVSGALHEETIYGPTLKAPAAAHGGGRPWATGWIEERGTYVYRKPLEALTVAMIPEIRDPAVRRLVEARLQAHGISPQIAKAIPAAVWKEPLRMPGPHGPVIRKVRLIKRDETIQPIRAGTACVKPGSNHHVAIFEYEEKGKRRRDAVFVSMLEAARRVRAGEPLIRRVYPARPEARFVMSLSRGEMVLGSFKGQERLVCFRTGASTQGQLYFVAHSDARKSNDVEKFAVKATTLVGRKVTVDLLGRLRDADKFAPACESVNPKVAALARNYVAGKVSLRAAKAELAAAGCRHLGAQFTGEVHLLRQR